MPQTSQGVLYSAQSSVGHNRSFAIRNGYPGMGRTLILTGRPAIGKTTLIKAVIGRVGERAGGFYTEEILGPGGRKGFRLIALAGPSGVIAHVDFKSRSQVGRYGVDVDAIDRLGAGAIRTAVDQRPIVIIDEIGRMELFSSQFQSAVLKAMSSPKTVVATAMLVEHPWVTALKAMPGVTVWEVTRQNRGALIEQVIEWIDAQSRA